MTMVGGVELPSGDYGLGQVPVEKVVNLGDFPFKKLDDGKQKGVVIDAIALKNMYQKLGGMYQEGIDKEFIAGYTVLLDAINTAYDEAFKC